MQLQRWMLFVIVLTVTASCQEPTLTVSKTVKVESSKVSPTAAKASIELGLRGQQYEQEGRYEEALSLTRQAIFTAQAENELAGLIRWQWQLGRIFTALKNRDEAIEAYQQAVQGLLPEKCFRWDIKDVPYAEIRPLFIELVDLLLQRAAVKQNQLPMSADLWHARDILEKLKTADLENYFQSNCIAASQDQWRAKAGEIADDQAAVIYPILLTDRLELLVTFPSQKKPPTIQRLSVAVGEAKIEAVVQTFREELQKGRYEPHSESYLAAAQQLYQWLIKPLQPLLAGNTIQTLVFVPSGALLTINLAALHDGNQFLIEKYAVVLSPGLTLTLPATTSPSKETQMLLSAVTEATQGYPKLPYAAREFNEIRRLFGRSKPLLNDQRDENNGLAAFKTQNFKDALNNSSYDVIHIISHAEFAKHSKDIAIVTYDGKLSLDELEKLLLKENLLKVPQREKPLELLTLSACSTAAGEETQWAALGLSGVAIKIGARSSLATLWQAYDLTTYILVTRFYQNWQSSTKTKAQALQEAQQYVIGSTYRHPFFWAQLVLIGNWR